MAQTLGEIEKVVAPAVEALGFELYACELSLGKSNTTLRVLVDGPKGITLDDCAKVSRQVATALDVADPFSGRYSLEVSSPGLDRPLLHPWHFERAVGKKAKLRSRVLKEGQRNFIGIIKKVDDGQVLVATEEQGEISFGLDEIEKARLIVEI